jgi:hypothetical protein
MAYNACKTGHLEQLRKVVYDCAIDHRTILDLIQTASVHNHHNIVYWFVATYSLSFNLQNYHYILNRTIKYNKPDSILILKLIPATYYNRADTNYVREMINIGWTYFDDMLSVVTWRYMSQVFKPIQLLLESEYLL